MPHEKAQDITAAPDAPVYDNMEINKLDMKAEEVENAGEASTPSYTEAEGKRVRLKMDLILLPVLCLMNLCSFLDKANIGNANTAGLSKDLHLSKDQYNFLLTIFYVVYTCCQWEFMLLKYISPKIWLAFVVTGWGTASLCQGFTHNYGGMLACRIVIAALEAGGGPAIGFYLSLMYPRGEYGLRWTIFQVTSCLANSFAGAMAYGLVQAKTSLQPWKLVFIVESIPTYIAAILLIIFVPSAPGKCIFLTKRQNEISIERHDRGSGVSQKHGFNWKELGGAFADPWVWIIGLIHFFGGAAFNSLSVFLTAIIKDMGYTSINSQGLSAPPWLVAYVVSVTCGYFSDKYSVRGWFIVAGQLVGGVGYLIIAFAGPLGARYFATFITCAGVYMAQPLMFSWCAANGETDSKRAASLVIFLVTGQCGSIMGSNIYNNPPRNILGNSICAGGLFINVFLSIGAMYYLKYRNRKKDELYGPVHADMLSTPAQEGQPHPAWRFVM